MVVSARVVVWEPGSLRSRSTVSVACKTTATRKRSKAWDAIPGFLFLGVCFQHSEPAIAARRCGRRWSVAASKLEALLARALTSPLWPRGRSEIDRPGVTVVRRPFEDADLDGAWWVVAAAPAHVNKRVRAAADARRIFVNAVDDPLHATAYLGGVIKRDGVTIAISTDGRAPRCPACCARDRRGAPRDLDSMAVGC